MRRIDNSDSVSRSRVLRLSFSKLHHCGSFRSKGINQNRNVILPFYSSPFLQHRSQPAAAVPARREQPQLSVSICSQHCWPPQSRIRCRNSCQVSHQRKLMGAGWFVVAARRQAFSPEYMNSSINEFMKIIVPVTKICSCIQMVVSFCKVSST